PRARTTHAPSASIGQGPGLQPGRSTHGRSRWRSRRPAEKSVSLDQRYLAGAGIARAWGRGSPMIGTGSPTTPGRETREPMTTSPAAEVVPRLDNHPANPARSPDWRWRRAENRLRIGVGHRLGSGRDDLWVRRALAFLRHAARLGGLNHPGL